MEILIMKDPEKIRAKRRRHTAIGNGCWRAMMKRCLLTSCKDYPSYGAKGIIVCQRWRSFGDFIADMGPRPSRGHSIDRIDNARGYDCGNCDDCRSRGAVRNARWSTQTEQQRNRTNNVIVDVGGQKKTPREWSAIHGVPEKTIRERLTRGWPPEKAVSWPRKYGSRRCVVTGSSE